MKMFCEVVFRRGKGCLRIKASPWSPQYTVAIFTVRDSSCGKVMFSQACVKNSVRRGVFTP